jgi:uncharacterized membrane protein YphA (DoxX/SURF4 family)
VRTETKVLLYSAAFTLPVAAGYWFWSYEETGTLLLLFMVLAPLLMGGYLVVRGWRLRRPEDRPDADPSAGAGAAVGRFPAASVWPLVMGLGSAIAAVGFVFGIWPVFAGVVLLAVGAAGLLRESRG